MSGIPLRLHLGCGEKYLQGYINIDFPPFEHAVMHVRADLYKDIRELVYPQDSVDEIRSHHVLEHFSRQEALRLLVLWRRWLKPSGLLRIETPDFESSAREYLAAPLARRFALGRHIFGSQEAAWGFHRDFWDPPKFQYVLTRLGYGEIAIRRFGNSLARRFPSIPLLNTLGRFLPASFYEAYGGNTFPSIEVQAHKTPAALDETEAAREILSKYLTGNEGEALLRIWLEEINLG